MYVHHRRVHGVRCSIRERYGRRTRTGAGSGGERAGPFRFSRDPLRFIYVVCIEPGAPAGRTDHSPQMHTLEHGMNKRSTAHIHVVRRLVNDTASPVAGSHLPSRSAGPAYRPSTGEQQRRAACGTTRATSPFPLARSLSHTHSPTVVAPPPAHGSRKKNKCSLCGLALSSPARRASRAPPSP